MKRNTKHVSTPRGDIAYTERGSGPAALFVHGVCLEATDTLVADGTSVIVWSDHRAGRAIEVPAQMNLCGGAVDLYQKGLAGGEWLLLSNGPWRKPEGHGGSYDGVADSDRPTFTFDVIAPEPAAGHCVVTVHAMIGGHGTTAARTAVCTATASHYGEVPVRRQPL
jgi:hypothetical protein